MLIFICSVVNVASTAGKFAINNCSPERRNLILNCNSVSELGKLLEEFVQLVVILLLLLSDFISWHNSLAQHYTYLKSHLVFAVVTYRVVMVMLLTYSCILYSVLLCQVFSHYLRIVLMVM